MLKYILFLLGQQSSLIQCRNPRQLQQYFFLAMAICSLSVSFLKNACGLYHVPIHPSNFVLVGPNFEFGYTQSQLALAEPFFMSVDPVVGFANFADLADPLTNLLDLWFDLNVPNFSCFEKLTTTSFFIFLMFLVSSSKFLISV